MKLICISAFLALLASAPAMASHPCARIAEPAQRLACFDRHYPAAPAAQAGPKPAAAATPIAALPTPAAASATRFGLPPSADERARELDSISAVVREIGSLRHGERVFVRDNGQRWAERVAESRPLNPGDRITVTRGSFGSFLLVTPAGVGLRVRRLP
jgi:hypothetical protein